MTQTKILDGVKIESIFHPSDFSEASEVAFVHALKMALVAGAKLTMLHVEASPGAEWQDFPGVRDTLERWGLIPKDSPKSAVGQLGIKVAKVLRLSKDPVKACLGFLEENPTDLIVLAVRQHEGRIRWSAEKSKWKSRMKLVFWETDPWHHAGYSSSCKGYTTGAESACFSSQNVVQSTKNRRKGALEMWRWHNLWCATAL
jgi:nucleotide-binding universal stress UspA family protein